MKSYAYTKDSLAEHSHFDDQRRFGLASETAITDAISKLHAKLQTDDMPFNFKIFKKNGRQMCMARDYETALLVRKVNNDFTRLTGTRMTGRDETIRALKEVCSEAQPMRIIRLDIKKFYDSIPTEDLIKATNSGLTSTYALRRTIEKYLRWSKQIGGIPTGVSLSASLAEYYIKSELDDKMEFVEGIHFFRRYVDDIVIACSPDRTEEEYIKTVESLLPYGLRLNSDPKKRDLVDLSSSKKHGEFNYLGYCFRIASVSKLADPHTRSVELDISEGKVRKRKTRFVYALLQYLKDGNEDDLRARFLLLNSGYTFWDASKARTMSAGICNTYAGIDLPSPALAELQRFYKGTMLNPRFKLYHRLRLSPLSKSTRRLIVSFDLQTHILNRKYFNFNATDLAHLSSCWKDA